MDASKGSVAQVSVPDDGADEVSTVFHESRGLLRAALLNEYLLVEDEARQIEGDLLEWFGRFCRRPGAPAVREGRDTLVIMACIFARGHQRQRIHRDGFEPDERLERVLWSDPVEVARGVTRRLRFLYRRLHTE